jgi:hypothetical protein
VKLTAGGWIWGLGPVFVLSTASDDKLVAVVPAAKALNEKAVAVLVFPSITRAGLAVGSAIRLGDFVI